PTSSISSTSSSRAGRHRSRARERSPGAAQLAPSSGFLSRPSGSVEHPRTNDSTEKRMRSTCCLLVFLALAPALPLAAGLQTVTSAADSGAGSLRDTVTAALPGDTIQFDASLAGQTITLTTAEIAIGKPLTIDGGSNRI